MIQAAENKGMKPDQSQERVVSIVLNEDELNWKDMIYRLVQEEGMDPWNIDVSRLAARFLKMMESLKEADFRIGGKVVLASSLLLKIKSDRLLLDDLQNLDRLINDVQEPEEDELLDEGGSFEFEQSNLDQFLNEEKKIVPRTPQPRERKVSVFDLVDALEQALDSDVKKRQQVLRRDQQEETTMEAPKKTFDLGEKMQSMQKTLKKMLLKKTSKIYFNDLLPSEEKQDAVFTFLPLLHMENQRKIDMQQEEHFGPIQVLMHNRKLLDE
ncbi:MAG: segregation/condensation protein A [Candidatus Woesearchaeota archaeon]